MAWMSVVKYSIILHAENYAFKILTFVKDNELEQLQNGLYLLSKIYRPTFFVQSITTGDFNYNFPSSLFDIALTSFTILVFLAIKTL
jgi:hypothetical protein